MVEDFGEDESRPIIGRAKPGPQRCLCADRAGRLLRRAAMEGEPYPSDALPKDAAAMTTDDVIDIFRKAGAYLEGHFILTSGLRSPVFLQKARVFMHADATETLCKALAGRIAAEVPGPIDYVVGPAVGGLIPAYETSRHLKVPAIWVERENGVFRLRRFEIVPGARVVIIEDIVTTGLSIRETIDCLKALGAQVLAAACIIDRSAGKVDVGVPLIALAEYEVPAYPADDLPPELAAIQPVKPGSRSL